MKLEKGQDTKSRKERGSSRMSKVFKLIESFGLVAMSVGLTLVLILGSVVPAKAGVEKVVKIGNLAVLTQRGLER